MKQLLQNKAVLAAVIGGVLLLAAAPTYYFYSQYQKSQKMLQNPQAAQQEEVKKLVDEVAQLVELPKGEIPTVATVADKDRLKDQPFFVNSQNGDKVLIFTSSKRAILYRPSVRRIIDIAPINLTDTGTPSVAGTSTTNQPPKFALHNGTTIVGLTKKYEVELKDKVKNALIVDRDNAQASSHTQTVLMDVLGNKGSLATKFAADLGITVEPYDKAEASGGADFIIIVGSDKGGETAKTSTSPTTTPAGSPTTTPKPTP